MSTSEPPINYESLKALSIELNRPVSTLYALASGNDPFYAGSPARKKAAEWFVSLWQRFLLQHGVHLRRIHYVLVSQAEPVQFPDGTPYTNTEACWQALVKAAS